MIFEMMSKIETITYSTLFLKIVCPSFIKMAVRLVMDSLTQEQITSIRKALYFQPETPGFARKKKFHTVAKDPILFYSIDKPLGHIILPYTFANSLFKCHLNSNRQYLPIKYSFTGSLRDYQVPVYDKCMEHLTTKGTTILGAYPSFGKTILSACMAATLGGLTLIVYPLTTLESGWNTTFSEKTNASIWINNPVTNKEPFDITKHQVILTMDTQYHKISPEILSHVKILVIDECHMFCTPGRINCLLGANPLYVIACTATLERADKMESLIHAVCGTHGVFLKNPKPFNVYKIMTGISVEVEQNKQGDPDWSKLVKKYCESERRNRMILDIIRNNISSKFMILTWNKKHAYYLSELCIKNGITSDVMAGNKKKYNDSQVLVGTAQKIGTAFDEQLSCPDWSGIRSNILMLVGSTKSLSGLHQFCGRVYRSEFPVIIDFVDNNSICKRHWTERKKYYLDPDTKGTIHDVDYSKFTHQENPGNSDSANGAITVPDLEDEKQLKSVTGNMASKIRAKLMIVSPTSKP